MADGAKDDASQTGPETLTTPPRQRYVLLGGPGTALTWTLTIFDIIA